MTIFNNQIEYDWLNKSLNSFKLLCKSLFLTWQSISFFLTCYQLTNFTLLRRWTFLNWKLVLQWNNFLKNKAKQKKVEIFYAYAKMFAGCQTNFRNFRWRQIPPKPTKIAKIKSSGLLLKTPVAPPWGRPRLDKDKYSGDLKSDFSKSGNI